MSRTFTLEEANALIPRVTAAFTRTTQLMASARQIAKRLAAEGAAPAVPGGLPQPQSVAHDPELSAALALATNLAEAALEETRSLEAVGIRVRDLERGLIDFRSVLDGQREVWLCWQLGEREIRYWHDLDAGFIGRQTVEGHAFFRARQLRAPRD